MKGNRKWDLLAVLFWDTYPSRKTPLYFLRRADKARIGYCTSTYALCTTSSLAQVFNINLHAHLHGL